MKPRSRSHLDSILGIRGSGKKTRTILLIDNYVKHVVHRASKVFENVKKKDVYEELMHDLVERAVDLNAEIDRRIAERPELRSRDITEEDQAGITDDDLN